MFFIVALSLKIGFKFDNSVSSYFCSRRLWDIWQFLDLGFLTLQLFLHQQKSENFFWKSRNHTERISWWVFDSSLSYLTILESFLRISWWISFFEFFSTKRTKSFCCVIFETINYLAWDETAIYCVYNFRNPTLIHRGVFLFLLFFETLNCLAWDETAKLEH